MNLGTIISLEETPSTIEYSFVVEAGNESVKKGQFVQNETKNGLLFGFISEITRANRYFERAESVAEYERHSPMQDHFPVASWDHMIAQVKVLGVFNNGKFERAFKPPVPGSKIVEADEKVLKQFLGFTDNGLLLGKLQHHELDARIDMTRLFQKHLAILAMSGAGKSHLSSVMLEELLDRKAEDGRIAVVVIDIHGEYTGFKFDGNYGNRTKIIEGNEIFVPLRKVAPEMLEEWLPNLSGPQRELLRAVMHGMRGSKEKISMKELVSRLEAYPDAKEDTKKTLKRALGEIRRYRFVTSGKENPRLMLDVKPGELLILDFSPLDSMKKKQILVSYVARRLFNLRKKGKIAPFLLLVEEAHNFAREKAEAHEAISRSIIETIAREGRKFGASLCLISQRPVNLSTTALSQCNTHIILRITNPNDLDHIQQSSEGIDARIAKSISGLRVGEAILVGEAANYPVFVNVRQRKSSKREKGLPLQQQAIEYEQNVEKKEKNVEAFL